MNTLIFLSGLGIGALVVTLLVIAFLGYASKKAVNGKENAEKYDKQHADLLAMHKERNRLVALQTNSLCTHRKVTATEDGAECERCGFEVTFNHTTGNWE